MIRTRFAPSPTGYIHLGNIRTALYAWLFARHNNGKFVLRIEDTDQERSTKEAVKAIFDAVEWLGLNYDEGPFYQSERLDHYRAIAEKLIEKGLAYRCYCTQERIDNLRAEQLKNKEKPRYDGFCRAKNLPPRSDAPYVIRFKNPQTGTVEFDDQIQGHLSFENSELDDLVIIRSDGYPTYNFSVVIDDSEMQITHVVRGADHINNTPRQINIFKALGATPPIFAHQPLILGKEGKLSKRDGSANTMQYREEGFLPEAMLNYLVRLGWAHGDQEIFSREEMIKLFDLKDIHKSPSTFGVDKLRWLNRHYIKTLDPTELAKHLQIQMDLLKIDINNGPKLTDIILALRERADTLQEMAGKSRIYFEDDVTLVPEDAAKHLTAEAKTILEDLQKQFIDLADWQGEKLHQIVANTTEKFAIKMGKVAQPLRVAITGGTFSPPIDVTLQLIGKARVLKRIKHALKFIEGQ